MQQASSNRKGCKNTLMALVWCSCGPRQRRLFAASSHQSLLMAGTVQTQGHLSKSICSSAAGWTVVRGLRLQPQALSKSRARQNGVWMCMVCGDMRKSIIRDWITASIQKCLSVWLAAGASVQESSGGSSSVRGVPSCISRETVGDSRKSDGIAATARPSRTPARSRGAGRLSAEQYTNISSMHAQEYIWYGILV